MESVETRPPFLWVSCQSPEIAFRARTFPLWCFSLYINLGLGGMILLPSCLSHPQLPSFYILSLSFTCLNLGEKQDKRREEGDEDKPSTEKAAASLCAVGSSQPFWSISKYLFQMLTDTENSILFSFQIQSPSWILSFCFIFSQFYPPCKPP